MLTELTNTILLLGAAQGLFLAAVLATKRSNAAANRVLAVAMLAFSTGLLQDVFYDREYFNAFPHFIGVSVPLVFVFGPILYIYAKTVSEGGRRFRKAWLLHFIPFALVTLYLLPFYVQSGAEKIGYLARLMRDGAPRDIVVIQNLYFPHGIAYVVLTILQLKRHRAALRDTHSYVERINLVWLRNLTIGMVAVWVIATVLHLFDIAGFATGELQSRATSIAVAILVYAIGYLGLKQPEIFHPPQRPPSLAQSAPPVAGDQNSGYERSGLTQAQAAAYAQRLVQLMEDKQLYKDSLLTLQELAEEMEISEHHLSQVINTQLRKNFYDFVNGYRAEEAMKRLRDPRSSGVTILTIALESGFNTKSSFNTFFKKYTGRTPSQYRMQAEAA